MTNNNSNTELLQSFLNYLQFEKRSSKHTVVSYATDIAQFSEYVGESVLVEVREKHIRNWVMELSKQGVLARSINRKVVALRSFYSFLQKSEQAHTNPAAHITALKAAKRLPVFVEENQMDTVYNSVEFEEGFAGVRNKLIIALLYETGMRRAELLGLHLHSFDLENRQVKVLGKRSKERMIPLLPELVETIRNYTQERAKYAQAHTFFFITDTGKPAYEGLIYRVVKKYIGAVSTIEKRSPHVLRHSCATHLLNNGADLQHIKEILGHANLSATQVYTHNSLEKIKEIYKHSHPRN
ncbi:MAG: tyrosine-type recombinase/integrase [Bacteroidales bacterium]|jgi:integrase/recombinase XerC|nr:tyrosine-type recombinase/integrase [Bacteroidales bacterium]